MSLNCNEINVILSELSLEGSFIQDIVQPGFNTLALYTYKNASRKTILICTAHDVCRIHSTKQKITRNDKPLRFMELLKSKIKGARIDSCIQIGLDRIVAMKLSHGEETLWLYVRLWSAAANVVLCDEDNVIIDAMFRRPAKNETTGKKFLLSVKDTGKMQKEWPVRTFDEVQAEYDALHADNTILSFNEKVDAWYSNHAHALSVDVLRAQTEKWYSTTKIKREAALEKLKAKQAVFKNAKQYKHQGDLVLSYGHVIDGTSNFIECEDYTTGNTVRIAINPQKTAQENAALYYEQYKKAQHGLAQLEHDIALEEKQIESLNALYQKIIHEQNPVKIEQLLRRNTIPRQQKKKSHPGLLYIVDGWYIFVGRDSDENDKLLRYHAKGNDMWLHVRDFSGGYVFIKNKSNKPIPHNILLDAANLAVYYSKARKAGKADLYYTQVKYLRRAKNGPKGLVLPTQEKNIFIELDSTRLNRLDTIRHEMEN